MIRVRMGSHAAHVQTRNKIWHLVHRWWNIINFLIFYISFIILPGFFFPFILDPGLSCTDQSHHTPWLNPSAFPECSCGGRKCTHIPEGGRCHLQSLWGVRCFAGEKKLICKYKNDQQHSVFRFTCWLHSLCKNFQVKSKTLNIFIW